ncbi:MAG: molecular chaperone TorD family protein [Desulfobulbaceae bacterium]|uniref:Molecular chaperone TorD family protein n=1 Tax=Candidatus Desulfatifera sulfidica TaxID=2841691 RepID=A0A8J6N9F4_9BACT|nr:molecular chaperone TorD family protein [Candidatus Desulfatifera sulfidica]
MDPISNIVQLSNCFRLLAACFYQPDTELFKEEELCAKLQESCVTICPKAIPPIQVMAMALQKTSDQDMQVTYAELFVGPFELKASPYGSTYLDLNRQLMGDSTMWVKKLYQQAGLEVDIQQPPDHIAIELEFLSHLWSLEAESLLAGSPAKAAKVQNERQVFLDSCLLPWIQELTDNIRSGTDSLFYRGLADCLDAVVQQLPVQETTPFNHERRAAGDHASPSPV